MNATGCSRCVSHNCRARRRLTYCRVGTVWHDVVVCHSGRLSLQHRRSRDRRTNRTQSEPRVALISAADYSPASDVDVARGRFTRLKLFGALYRALPRVQRVVCSFRVAAKPEDEVDRVVGRQSHRTAEHCLVTFSNAHHRRCRLVAGHNEQRERGQRRGHGRNGHRHGPRECHCHSRRDARPWTTDCTLRATSAHHLDSDARVRQVNHVRRHECKTRWRQCAYVNQTNVHELCSENGLFTQDSH